jgi:purine nucleoside phosphorylase
VSGGAVESAARAIASRIGAAQPRIALILGSGLGGLASELEARTEIAFGEIPGLPRAA